MDPETEKEIQNAYLEWQKEYIDLLMIAAFESFLTGQIGADEVVGMPRDPATGQLLDKDRYFAVISEAAMQYSEQYGRILTEEGATVFNGQKTPWLWSYEEQQRADISRIIDEGIRDGKGTGTVQGRDGSYPKGSIAEDLQGYFSARSSHASTVARTEVARVQNVGALNRYKDRGYSMVKVFDGVIPTSCDACLEANGQTWTIDDAMVRELEHPNCLRAFGPVWGE